MCKFVKNVLILCLSCILVFVISVSSYAATYNYSDIRFGIEIQDHDVVTTSATFTEFTVSFYNSNDELVAKIVDSNNNQINIDFSNALPKTGRETEWGELLSAGTRWVISGFNDSADYPYLYLLPGNPDPGPCGGASSAHTHNFQWQTITEPTMYSDGLEGEVCSCGATRNTQPISAFGYTINDYATKMVNASKSGQVIILELGEWNSFPKAFMEKVAAKSAQNVTFVFHYKWNHVKQEITIPAGTLVDTSLDWYGPAKMQELYGAN